MDAIARKIYGDKRLLAIIIIINIIGAIAGLFYYWDQLAMTPWYLWLFVPDCPLYVFFMAIALSLIWLGRPHGTFNLITAVGCAMYGTWTMLTLIYFSEMYFSPANALMSSLLFISHFGMAVESLLLVPYVKYVKAISWADTAVWFIILDLGDFYIRFTYDGHDMRLHPLAMMEYIARNLGVAPFLAKVDNLLYLTIGLTIAAMLFIFIMARIWPVDKSVTKDEGPYTMDKATAEWLS